MNTITCDQDWLDLRDGDLGTVIGKVESSGPNHIIIMFSDWGQLYVRIDDGPLSARPVPDGVRVKLHVERTGDGVMTTTTMLEAAEIFS